MPFSSVLRVNKYLEGQTLLVNKELGWTSFDVVNKLRYTLKNHFNLKKIKVGHAGTLDPLASGLLIICTGKKTKVISEIQEQRKVYNGELFLGATTASYDLETTPENFKSIENLSPDLITQKMAEFIGVIDQTPPIFSAKKVNGKRAYDIARSGQTVNLKKNTVSIYRFEMEQLEFPKMRFEVECSKGTYIRSLAHDLGQALQCGAYLSGLRRTQIGNYQLSAASSIEETVSRIRMEEE